MCLLLAFNHQIVKKSFPRVFCMSLQAKRSLDLSEQEIDVVVSIHRNDFKKFTVLDLIHSLRAIQN